MYLMMKFLIIFQNFQNQKIVLIEYRNLNLKILNTISKKNIL